MKLRNVVLAISLVVVASSAQAGEIKTPEILSSVSPHSIQKMSEAESSDARGEYLVCPTGQRCYNWFSRTNYHSQRYSGGYLLNAGWNVWLGMYVSR